MRQPFDIIMNENKNPLRNLPKAQQLQIMVLLSVMWSTVFCVAISSWFWWGELVIGHLAIAVAICITGMTFSVVKKKTHRDMYQETDGSARYDDLWGA